MTDEEPTERRPPSAVPSWIMLGFAMGVLAMIGWRRDRPPHGESGPPPPTTVEVAPPPPTGTATNTLRIEDQPSLTIVEALFEQYRAYAFWEDDRTEIAVWNTRTLAFSDCFDVLRTDTGTYFKTIPALTRLPLEGYGPRESPLLFTETQTQRAARYLQSRGQVPRNLPPPPAPAPPPRVRVVPSESP